MPTRTTVQPSLTYRDSSTSTTGGNAVPSTSTAGTAAFLLGKLNMELCGSDCGLRRFGGGWLLLIGLSRSCGGRFCGGRLCGGRLCGGRLCGGVLQRCEHVRGRAV